MEALLEQIEGSLDFNLYYPALFVSLTIPDICGAIDDGSDSNIGERYRKWYDTYVPPQLLKTKQDAMLANAAQCRHCSPLPPAAGAGELPDTT